VVIDIIMMTATALLPPPPLDVNVWFSKDLLPGFSQSFLQISVFFSACCAASDDTPPQPGWRHPSRGRRRSSWLHQVCTDLNLPPFDVLNLVLGRTSWRAVASASVAMRCLMSISTVALLLIGVARLEWACVQGF